jgi:hypothetical protein
MLIGENSIEIFLDSPIYKKTKNYYWVKIFKSTNIIK